LLGLGRCQSNDFDAQIADATITMLQHILLTLRYRIENYESMQGLFSDLTEQIIQERLDRRLWGLFVETLNIIESLFDGIDEDELMKKLFHNDEARKRIALLLNEPEKLETAA
jgi:hypothetical protein